MSGRKELRIAVSQAELMEYLTRCPEKILKKSKIIRHEFRTPVGELDGLLLDASNNLWILEVKKEFGYQELDHMLQVYEWFKKNIETLSRGELIFTPGKNKRRIGIIVISQKFNPQIQRVSKYLKIPLLLKTYSGNLEGGKKRICIEEFQSESKPPPIDVALLIMTYKLETQNIEPSLEKIGLQLRGIYSPNDLYDAAIRLSDSGIVYVGMTRDNEYGISLRSESVDLAKESYASYWERLQGAMERVRGGFR